MIQCTDIEIKYRRLLFSDKLLRPTKRNEEENKNQIFYDNYRCRETFFLNRKIGEEKNMKTECLGWVWCQSENWKMWQLKMNLFSFASNFN